MYNRSIICSRCDKVFNYKWKGWDRKYCDICKNKNNKPSQAPKKKCKNDQCSNQVIMSRVHCSMQCRTEAKMNSKAIINFTELDITYGELMQLKEITKICDICKNPEIVSTISRANHKTNKNKVNKLSADHDHKTNKFRGLLCVKCNSKLGWYERYEDSITKYLRR